MEEFESLMLEEDSKLEDIFEKKKSIKFILQNFSKDKFQNGFTFEELNKKNLGEINKIKEKILLVNSIISFSEKEVKDATKE